MVEAAGLPGLDAVALVTLLAQAAFVRVVVVVAVIAHQRRITMFGILFVAARTGEALMRAFQRKIGPLMIKGVRVEMHDVAIASDMLGMAGLARYRVDIFYAAVKAMMIFDVLCYFLVAVEA